MDHSEQLSTGPGAPPGRITDSPPATASHLGSAPSVQLEGPGLNEKILFWASFLTLIAAGIGFAIRGAILQNWGTQFGFTKSELGTITGAGLVGFVIPIIVFSALADTIGYRVVMIFAFLFHVTSAVVTLAATPIFDATHNKDAVSWCLFVGGFLFALGNGTCEAVINPLTATLFPRQKTHWLNILHAGWPGGLILGALLGVVFEQFATRWEVQMSIFLLPTLGYGFLMLPRPFPRSEASSAGVPVSTMLKEFASPILLLLLVLMALVGYVELGTDSWISNITGTILGNKSYGLFLFIWTSGLMFVLRFCAGPIVHKISPLGLLFGSALLGATGLFMLGRVDGAIMVVLAATVYGFGKTFLWPTMLGVVSERYPRGGSMTLGTIGGVGMLSAGLLGGPGIGYFQDYYASSYLKEKDEATYARYKSDDLNGFLFFPKISGLDGSKTAVVADDGKQLAEDVKIYKDGHDGSLDGDKTLKALADWWTTESKKAEHDKPLVADAGLYGGRMALSSTAAIPVTMALGYLCLILVFRMQGGYQARVLTGHAAEDEKFTGGVAGPVE
jgi:MFS family permease